ncbi:FecR family protein [Chitinophaga flava]|uniref:Uncharacterized protein n=1 Tax=Chitinophaga flava TaxID=2259036 RepID=A0A365XVC5_9BACT|nr:FecR family protein [Chitinophaga flava]RBL90316.1 hypothetical protein DF182_28025 [Chitinophaga flava]
MPISKEQIARYLEGRCTQEEQRQITDYLYAHPEALEQVLDEQGWGEEMVLPEEQSDRMLSAIRKKTYGHNRRRILWSGIGAAAAAVTGLLVLSWHSNRQQPSPLAHTQITVQQPVYTTVQVYNGADSTIKLPDGSRITMKPAAVIRYDTAYAQYHRDLYLEGEAVFDVAKKASLPFTVHSGDVTTTALGTVFMVSAQEHAHCIKVRLMSGKVVVKTDGSSGTYLKPGQELAWEQGNRDVAVYAYAPVTKPAAPPVKLPEPTVQISNSHIEFIKCPVADVFSVLYQQYGIQINASSEDLKGCFFSGTLTGQQEADDIIHTIATLNQLTLTKDNTGYHISK